MPLTQVTKDGLDPTAISDKLGYTPVSPTQLATKQDSLVSGTNIKTVGGNSILGSGDLTVAPPDYLLMAQGII